MSESKHTPGPWVAEATNGGFIVKAKSGTIAKVMPTHIDGLAYADAA